MISSPGCCRPLNGLSGPIGIDFYPTSIAWRKVRNGTELAGPDFSLTSPLDILYPTLRRFDSGQAWPDTPNLELDRRDEGGPLCSDGVRTSGLADRHDRTVHCLGSCGKLEVGGYGGLFSVNSFKLLILWCARTDSNCRPSGS